MDIELIKKYLLNNWFYNLKNRTINQDILLLCFKNKADYKTFLESEINKEIDNILVTTLQKLTKRDLNNIKKRSIILVSFQEISFGHLRIFYEENIRLLYYQISDLNYIEYYFNHELHYVQTQQISLEFLPYFYLQTTNPIDIIYNIYYIKEFISVLLDFDKNSIFGFSKNSVKQFLFRNIDTISVDTILNDIKFLERQNILTSRLAIFIYKVCTFECDSSDTKIGEYFKKIYKKSRVYNNKSFGISNMKGYFIHDMHLKREYDIRRTIASNLLAYKACDDSIISQATGISLEELQILKSYT